MLAVQKEHGKKKKRSDKKFLNVMCTLVHVHDATGEAEPENSTNERSHVIGVVR